MPRYLHGLGQSLWSTDLEDENVQHRVFDFERSKKVLLLK